MGKKRAKRQTTTQTPAQVARGIRVELRSIVRGLESLRNPFDRFELVLSQPSKGPRHRVLDLKFHEKLLEDTLHLIGSIWHLKDRLNAWVKVNCLQLCDKQGKSTTIREIANRSIHLQVCSDLINTKKHGKSENLSKLDPLLSGMRLDTQRSGTLGIRYDGAIKETDLLVTKPEPIPYEIEIWTGDGKATLGNAIEFAATAFRFWLPLIRQMGVLGNDPESQRLKDLLYSKTAQAE